VGRDPRWSWCALLQGTRLVLTPVRRGHRKMMSFVALMAASYSSSTIRTMTRPRALRFRALKKQSTQCIAPVNMGLALVMAMVLCSSNATSHVTLFSHALMLTHWDGGQQRLLATRVSPSRTMRFGWSVDVTFKWIGVNSLKGRGGGGGSAGPGEGCKLRQIATVNEEFDKQV
jgi:hypothetical protein